MQNSPSVPEYKELVVAWRSCNRVGKFAIFLGGLVILFCFPAGYWTVCLLGFLVGLVGRLFLAVSRAIIVVRDIAITSWHTRQLLDLNQHST